MENEKKIVLKEIRKIPEEDLILNSSRSKNTIIAITPILHERLTILKKRLGYSTYDLLISKMYNVYVDYLNDLEQAKREVILKKRKGKE